MLTIMRIAFRNASRQKKRSFLLGGAIAFGVMIITLVNSFTAGLVGNIKENFSYAFGGHVFISGSEMMDSGRVVGRMQDNEDLIYALDGVTPLVDSLHRRSRTFATIIFGSKQTMSLIDGVDFERESELAKGLQIVSGSLADLSDEKTLVLPKPIADRLGVRTGETVLARLPTVTGQQNVGEFRVIAIIEDTSSLGMATAYAGLSYLNGLLGLEPAEYQVLNVFLKDMKSIDSVSDEIYRGLSARQATVERPLEELPTDARDREEREQQAFGQLFGEVMSPKDVEPWEGTKFTLTTLNDMMKPVESMVSVLDTVGLVIFLILLLITAVGIMNTFRMVLIERMREIGTMRAFGMQRGSVRNIFLLEALFISIGGGIAGIALAGAVISILSRVSFAHVEGMQFFLNSGRLTFSLMPKDLATNLLILAAMSLLAAYLPARAAAGLEPARALGSRF